MLLYLSVMSYDILFFYLYGDPQDLHVLTHSFPTRRSSYLVGIISPDKMLRAVVLPAPFVPKKPKHSPGCTAKLRGLTATLRSEEHTSELQSLMRISYAVFCLKKKHINPSRHTTTSI